MSNLILILLDDVGIDQLSCYNDQNVYSDPSGYPYAYTPNINRIAQSGLRFNQYRSTPVCSPARASIQTGRYSFEHGVGYVVEPNNVSSGFIEFNKAPAPVFPTLPQVLNCRTFAVGKWHLGSETDIGGTMDAHPIDLGYDQWTGMPRNLVFGTGPSTSGAYYNYIWSENGVRCVLGGIHASERTTDKAIEYITNASGQWFGYVAFNAAHTPLYGANWPIDHTGFGPLGPGNEQRNTRFRACLENLDYHIGRILDVLDGDTYVMIAADNGTGGLSLVNRDAEFRYPIGHPLHQPNDENTTYSFEPYDPDRVKQTIYEGGLRCPLLVYGPHVPSGVRNQLIDCIDLYPTIIRLLGQVPPTNHAIPFHRLLGNVNPDRTLRSFSTVQYFQPNGILPSGERNWYSAGYIRKDPMGTWKLLHSISSGVDYYEFYRLDIDPLELNPLMTDGKKFNQILADYRALVY